MNKSLGVIVGFCLSLTLLSVSSVSNAAPQVVGTKCVKAGSFRTTKNVKYRCKKSAKGLRWVITSPKGTPTTTTSTTATTSTTTRTLPIPDPVITNVEPCRLQSALESKSGGIGFPRHTTKLRSTGGVRLLVLFVDFPDSVATKATESVLKIISPESERLYSEMSYGRVAFELVPVNRWLRMSKESSAYNIRRNSSFGFLDHRNYLEEALRLGTIGLDTSTLDGFIVLTNPETKTIELGPAFALDDEFWGIRTGSKLWMAGTNSGFDLNYLGYKWMNHEIGHTMGLPDLYAYSGSSHRFVGGWSLMGLISGHAPEFFAWERWLLSWLDDNQVICLPSGSITATLNAVPVVGGQKMIVTPINQYQAVVVEVRRQLGNDFYVREEGPLVYLVDTRLRGGNGVIKVLPINDIDVEKKSAPLSVGETLIFEGMSVRYNSRTSYGDEITVTRN